MPEPDTTVPSSRERAEGVDERLALVVHRLGSEVLTLGEEAVLPLGIDGREYLTLAILGTDRPESQLDLARLAWKAPPIMVAVVDGLEAKGLVSRRRSPADRRRTVVELTASGQEVLARADAIMNEVTVRVFGALTPRERTELHDTLRRALTTLL